ncbi:MAG: hypothetical protein IAX21_09085 [Candidatus Bathyarchaeota archaeon]|nr:hypothetical protein [Candidatus Bathyarchaeum tardum]WGM88973.1 MAG: hypothetical protein NUK63_08640 [Candidatus Bathyarchaeum tardum]WNZ28790.1 MAG: hypothetical protein IAX21_09085 [Candidatus Bathyarchaeota archaeon]
MVHIGPIPENIVERKVIVYKSRIDSKSIRATAEKMKTGLFSKMFFMNPKPHEVQIISIEKYYEPYLVAEAEYHIDYSKNWTHNIQVNETMLNLTLYGGKVEPVSLKDHLNSATKIVKLTGEGRYKINEKIRLVFDSHWSKVGLEELPLVPFEEQPENVLRAVDQKFENSQLNNQKEIDLLKSKIVNRPENITCIHDELFDVNERTLIYKPMYDVVVKNLKTNKEATLTIDAITGNTKSRIHKLSAPTQKDSTKKPVTSSPSKKAKSPLTKIIKKETTIK